VRSITEFVSVSAFACALLAAPQVFAATVCVSQNVNSNCEPTIQGGINLAVAGDRVSIQRGSYEENVIVPAGKDGLMITGPRTAIIQLFDTGDGLTILSKSVLVQGITILNGTGNSIVIGDAVSGTELRNVRLIGPEGDCVGGAGASNTGTLIRNSTFFACGSSSGSAIDLSGDGIEVTSNRFDNIDSGAVFIVGDAALVQRNRFQVIDDDDAIDITGDDAEVVNNRFNNSDFSAVDIIGDFALVRSNRVTAQGGGDPAIRVSGNEPQVISNRVQSTGFSAFDVDCTPLAGCTGGEVSRNTAQDQFNDSAGFDITTNGPAGGAFTIDRNRSTRASEYCYGLDVVDATIRQNRATGCGGAEAEACFHISGSANTVENNTARTCMGDGYSVEGSNQILTRNTVRDGGEDGFDVQADSTSVTLTRNTATNIAGVGFEVSWVESGVAPADATSAANNTARNAGLGLCDEGTATTDGGGNRFDDEQSQTNADCPVDVE